ncbi:phosphate propanoyltransferase/2-acylglycerol O-acyltransferase [Acididesulfobacillus acetoxydans]|uniref:Phosphate propanoyltransferase n=1 Tax=Acididesulfobacillus acetoxydans TaxID=1561005 RepID=A0A8S0Y4C0_9FIRM|nr:phosphate propanoyltransferase [Acididesulfobacillus acetoxydans]CAA7602855.1 phosphate propanoyltransferase/2-acylglycerol O-acyltransferase [Acididesulfobacillus acetoxydans]CEJ05736.1 Phosphate propanoyltransferase [Acididesulfobacillus acetoxydans]
MAKLMVPVGISSRHVHLTTAHIEQLFGPGHRLTKLKDLSQPGQFACEETVTLIGPKGSLSGVRILGPARKESQVELAATDTFKLGVKPPVRDSGNLAGTPGIELVGTSGRVRLVQGVIIAARHIHMSPMEAAAYGLKDGDRVEVPVPGERGGILDNVRIRVGPHYALDFHLDTDEGNAFGLKNGVRLEVTAARKEWRRAVG